MIVGKPAEGFAGENTDFGFYKRSNVMMGLTAMRITGKSTGANKPQDLFAAVAGIQGNLEHAAKDVCNDRGVIVFPNERLPFCEYAPAPNPLQIAKIVSGEA